MVVFVRWLGRGLLTGCLYRIEGMMEIVALIVPGWRGKGEGLAYTTVVDAPVFGWVFNYSALTMPILPLCLAGLRSLAKRGRGGLEGS